jgi:PAS domain S-box-containing protein
MPSEPEEVRTEKNRLQKMGISSFLVLPLTSGPALIGSVGFDTTSKEITWLNEDIDILKIYGQIIASALARKAVDRAVHESTGTAMMILDEDKTVSAGNREMERISGFTRDEIIGKIQWTQFVSPEDVELMKHYHVIRRTNPSAVPKNYEFGFIARDGKQISTYITVEMLPGAKKSVVSLIDISKEKIAQQGLIDS